MRQHVMITGGSSGIGKATACLYAARGADISILARRRDVIDAAIAEIDVARGGAGGRTLACAGDVADGVATAASVTNAVETLGVPDILITSAGIAVPGHFDDLPIENYRQHMDVNYFGTLHVLKATLPAMRTRGSGHIAMVSSGAGLIGIFGYTSYSPTKFALRGLAESLRGELKGDGIGVSIVYPPDTDTPQLAQENMTKPEETKAMTASAKMWSAEAVADKIVKGIDKGKFAIAPGWEMAALAHFGSTLRPIIHSGWDKIAAKTRKGR
ncbi:SDR family oxidoreductase [Shimia sediminis]|uniref:SDR family oxidoreductase n=1 Tax=Shimia sediminis TaxID=2497945 RepID=UPI000F8F1D44|nr:SDR family oxidoreductase [Shimia sediminis]